MSNHDQITYSFRRFPARITTVSIAGQLLTLSEGRYRLVLTFDQIVHEIGYGYGGIQGLFLEILVSDKVAYFHLFRSIPDPQDRLGSLHDIFEQNLGTYRSERENIGSLDTGRCALSIFKSWKRLAEKN